LFDIVTKCCSNIAILTLRDRCTIDGGELLTKCLRKRSLGRIDTSKIYLTCGYRKGLIDTCLDDDMIGTADLIYESISDDRLLYRSERTLRFGDEPSFECVDH